MRTLAPLLPPFYTATSLPRTSPALHPARGGPRGPWRQQGYQQWFTYARRQQFLLTDSIPNCCSTAYIPHHIPGPHRVRPFSRAPNARSRREPARSQHGVLWAGGRSGRAAGRHPRPGGCPTLLVPFAIWAVARVLARLPASSAHSVYHCHPPPPTAGREPHQRGRACNGRADRHGAARLLGTYGGRQRAAVRWQRRVRRAVAGHDLHRLGALSPAWCVCAAKGSTQQQTLPCETVRPLRVAWLASLAIGPCRCPVPGTPQPLPGLEGETHTPGGGGGMRGSFPLLLPFLDLYCTLGRQPYAQACNGISAFKGAQHPMQFVHKHCTPAPPIATRPACGRHMRLPAAAARAGRQGAAARACCGRGGVGQGAAGLGAAGAVRTGRRAAARPAAGQLAHQVRTVRAACTPACMPACTPACLPARLHARMHQ